MFEAYREGKSSLFILEKCGRINILIGYIEEIQGILENLVSLQNGLDNKVSDLGMMEISNIIFQAFQKYGMVSLSKDFIEKFVLREGCNENSIFENLLGIPRKYWKMKYEEIISNFAEILCRNIHFSYMLD